MILAYGPREVQAKAYDSGRLGKAGEKRT
jgi:hypothetical protein